jgi:hypothetical protein
MSNTVDLTDKLVSVVVKRAFEQASIKAMTTTGYVIEENNGWVVRKNASGSVERIKKIHTPVNKKLVLD